MKDITEWPREALRYDESVPEPGEGHAWIQWKGTSGCLDFRCRCGAAGHVDSDFTYFYKCAACGDTFAVGQTVRLYRIAPEAVEAQTSEGCTCTDPDPWVPSDE